MHKQLSIHSIFINLIILLCASACSAGCSLLPGNQGSFSHSDSVTAAFPDTSLTPDTSLPSDQEAAAVPSGNTNSPTAAAGTMLSVPVYHSGSSAALDLSLIPSWSGDPWVKVNGNIPFFTEEEINTRITRSKNALGIERPIVQSFEEYGELDALSRCTGAFACVGQDLMPTGERESISEIRPTGWHIVKYAGIDGNFLYNRCHLIAYGLTAENANERNLITGTRYMNTAGMNDFENETIAYIRRTGHHVLYRVTPVFQGNNLVASGVLMEGLSVEDSGRGIRFCIYAYNIQPDVIINYATGESTGALFTGTENIDHSPARQGSSDENTPSGGNAAPGAVSGSGNGSGSDAGFVEPAADITYVININSGKFHRPECSSVRDMNQHNRRDFSGEREELITRGYEPCGKCRP